MATTEVRVSVYVNKVRALLYGLKVGYRRLSVDLDTATVEQLLPYTKYIQIRVDEGHYAELALPSCKQSMVVEGGGAYVDTFYDVEPTEESVIKALEYYAKHLPGAVLKAEAAALAEATVRRTQKDRWDAERAQKEAEETKALLEGCARAVDTYVAVMNKAIGKLQSGELTDVYEPFFSVSGNKIKARTGVGVISAPVDGNERMAASVDECWDLWRAYHKDLDIRRRTEITERLRTSNPKLFKQWMDGMLRTGDAISHILSELAAGIPGGPYTLVARECDVDGDTSVADGVDLYQLENVDKVPPAVYERLLKAFGDEWDAYKPQVTIHVVSQSSQTPDEHGESCTEEPGARYFLQVLHTACHYPVVLIREI